MARSRRRSWGYDRFPPYVPAEERRASALVEAARLQKKGATLDPVRITGTAIATTFWGKAWCANLERYSDYASRLPRGRTYARQGAVIDLRIDKGKVVARVVGSTLYDVTIDVAPLEAKRWRAIVAASAGKIESVIELLQGTLSQAVMTLVTDEKKGLFPEEDEIDFQCSCPDSASMCKHVAAALYGVGARLDTRPELLFLLRGVDHEALVARAAAPMSTNKKKKKSDARLLPRESLSAIFGVDIASPKARR